jgi:hypothetical protein
VGSVDGTACNDDNDDIAADDLRRTRATGSG